MADYARSIVTAMEKTGVARLIFISSMGIYDEIPDSLGGGNVSQNPVLRPYREAADVIESSSLDYTVIRPGWFTSGPVDYEVTHKGEPFGGHDVSVGSIADAVRKIIEDPALYSHDSIGINRPGHLRDKSFTACRTTHARKAVPPCTLQAHPGLHGCGYNSYAKAILT